jgi:hypothetical protein
MLESLTVDWQSPKRAYERATLLTKQLRHHFFDTLCHAVAIENGATLITADNAYFAKAFRLGNISRGGARRMLKAVETEVSPSKTPQTYLDF